MHSACRLPALGMVAHLLAVTALIAAPGQRAGDHLHHDVEPGPQVVTAACQQCCYSSQPGMHCITMHCRSAHNAPSCTPQQATHINPLYSSRCVLVDCPLEQVAPKSSPSWAAMDAYVVLPRNAASARAGRTRPASSTYRRASPKSMTCQAPACQSERLWQCTSSSCSSETHSPDSHWCATAQGRGNNSRHHESICSRVLPSCTAA